MSHVVVLPALIPDIPRIYQIYFDAFRADEMGALNAADCQVIAIDPQHQGRKAGALIVQWGISLGEQPSILSRRRPPSACTRRWASRCLRSKIVHEAALFGADKDIVVPLMVRMPSCAKGVTFKEWCETGYPEFTVANQL
ncbi:hypothetical protein MY1884_004568 [Beauveria asiatica]